MEKVEVIDKIVNEPFRLSDKQIEAILSDSKYTRVIAGAGAGKTETITRRIAYLILVEGVEPASIVAFTFTEKAAQSMKSRIYQRVEQIAGSGATAKLGEMFVGTIHAYAKRILDDYFGYGNYSVLDANQEIAYLMRIRWGLKLQSFGRNDFVRMDNFLGALNMVQSELLEDSVLSKKAPDFFESYSKYIDNLEENKLLTFALMISRVVKHLREKLDTLSHVKHLVVDEFQDINQAQHEFIRLIAGNDDIFIVGDPRQSIYQWRGSDQSFFEVFSETFEGTKTVSIQKNRRSTKKIVRNANWFSDSFEVLRVEHLDPTRDREGFVGFAELETDVDEAVWIADQIERLRDEKKLSYSDFGILTRSVSYSAGHLISELSRRGIPYIVGGKVGLFRRDEAQALGRIFSWFATDGFWMENPYSWSEEVNGEDLLTSALAFWNNVGRNGVPVDAEEKLRAIKESLISEEPKRKFHNLTEVFHGVLLALGFKSLDFKDNNEAAVMANLGRFDTMLTDFEATNRIGGRTVRWQRDLKGLCWYMNTHAMKSYEEQPSDDIRDVNAVQVMTIHQSKGLEWPIVFVFSLTGTRFPPRSTGQERNWCRIPRDLFNAERYEGSVEDERRLFYVAITRPRDALVLSCFEKMRRSVGRSMMLDDVDWSQITELGAGDLPDFLVETNVSGAEIQTFTAGEIINYNICPYMYLMRNLWGYQPGLTQALGYGNALHHCLRIAGELVKKEGYSPRSAIGTAIHSGFHMHYVGGVVFDRFKESAGKALLDFVSKYEDDLSRIEEVEYRLEYPLQKEGTHATIMGKVDVILRDEDEFEVRDYKSRKREEDPSDIRSHEDAETQVRLYSLGLISMERNVTAGSVAYLGNSEVKPVDVDSGSLDETHKLAMDTVRRICAKDFNPCSGNSCERCDVAPICRWRPKENE
ncbi:MAG: ATP-dependent helicase [Dehalococcoidia bacterium]|nr:MAG: ATP-dependent helicase [Dehalococcoidia bacterium]